MNMMIEAIVSFRQILLLIKDLNAHDATTQNTLQRLTLPHTLCLSSQHPTATSRFIKFISESDHDWVKLQSRRDVRQKSQINPAIIVFI